MKKINLFLVLGFVSIATMSCGGNNSNSNTTHTTNVRVSESTDRWERIGRIGNDYTGYHHDQELYRTYQNEIIYVKQIGGETYYKNGEGESISLNPEYGTNSPYGRYKWKGTWHGRVFVFNF